MEMIQRLLAGYASKASTSSQDSSKFQSTSNDVALTEVSPSEVSCPSANSRSNDDSGNLPLGGREDVSLQEQGGSTEDSKDDLVVSPDKEVFTEQELGGASIARDEVGEADVKGN
ncbi:hypothetical protein GOP47_0018563 [Adiantum capillus-veneris]|nr:hypothetical protein GOP47_0018563 [Adiantum capillus-veneris]